VHLKDGITPMDKAPKEIQQLLFLLLVLLSMESIMKVELFLNLGLMGAKEKLILPLWQLELTFLQIKLITLGSSIVGQNFHYIQKKLIPKS
jgi:hypothetical protein